MSKLTANSQVPEPLVGFTGDVGGAMRGEKTIFRASSDKLGADFFLGLLARGSAITILLMLLALIAVLFQSSLPSIRQFGASFLVSTEWRPNATITGHPKLDPKGNVVMESDDLTGESKPVMISEEIPPAFGAAPVIYGTAISSLLALLIAVPLSFGSSLFLVRIGAWLAPTFIKSGIAGLCLTSLLATLGGNSPALTILLTCVGLGLTGVILWIAWRTEDPRVGPRRQIEIPVYGVIAISIFFLCVRGPELSFLTSAVIAIITTVLVHFLAPRFVGIVSFLIEFLAAIPSIAYGVWGVLVLGPFLQTNVEPGLNSFFNNSPRLWWHHNGQWSSVRSLGFLGTTDASPSGHDMLCAGLILGIMILPIITAISRDVLRAVPRIQIEGTQALGATWWQSSWAMLRYGRSGLFGAVILGLARAAGETMAVAMVIGNKEQIKSSILVPAQTMSGLIANQYRDAQGTQLGALTEVALILLLMSLAFNIVARYLVVGSKSRTAA